MSLSRFIALLLNASLILCVVLGSATVGLAAEVVASLACLACLVGLLHPAFRRIVATADSDLTSAMTMLTAVVFLLHNHVVAAGLYAILVAVLAYVEEPSQASFSA